MHHTLVTQELRRLLGPGGFELGCDECFAELDLYVELTLRGRDADRAVPGMREHLLGCPACREDLESLHALLGGLGAAGAGRPDGPGPPGC